MQIWKNSTTSLDRRTLEDRRPDNGTIFQMDNIPTALIFVHGLLIQLSICINIFVFCVLAPLSLFDIYQLIKYQLYIITHVLLSFWNVKQQISAFRHLKNAGQLFPANPRKHTFLFLLG
jgi:hypothetical protein